MNRYEMDQPNFQYNSKQADPPPKCKRLSGTGIGKCSLVTHFKICNLLYNFLLKIVNTVRSQMLQANAVTHENLYNNNQLPHYNYYYTMKEHFSITTIQTWIQRKPNLITFLLLEYLHSTLSAQTLPLQLTLERCTTSLFIHRLSFMSAVQHFSEQYIFQRKPRCNKLFLLVLGRYTDSSVNWF